jgi:hypothetical protein
VQGNTTLRFKGHNAQTLNCSAGGNIAKQLAPLAAAGADAGQVANAAIAMWDAIDKALSPVIGGRGSAALFERSLHLAREGFPWLGAAYESAAERDEFAAFRAALAQQAPGHAAAAHDSMLQTFLALLADLIGESLTQRLLRDVWEPPSSGHAVEDISP